jgi:hypothetical protein
MMVNRTAPVFISGLFIVKKWFTLREGGRAAPSM